MGKPKDSSKNRKWEQIRRDRLNQTFSALCKELPCKSNGGLLSKKAILVEALSFIQQLQKEKKELHDALVAQEQSPCRDDDIPGAEDVRAHISTLLQRQSQLVELLQDAGIAVPADPNAEQVSAQWSPKIFQNSAGTSEGKGTSALEKKKAAPASIVTPTNGVVHRVVLAEKTKPMNPLARKSRDNSPRKKMGKKIIGQGPLVLQSLPPHLVLTPASAPAAVPVIVSVAGVKTINPVIVVQSKPLISCNTTASFSARPIRPYPAVRPPGTKTKVPIPALKPKTNSPAKKKVVKVRGKTASKKVEPVQDVSQASGKNGAHESLGPEVGGLDKTVVQNERVEPMSDNIQEDLLSVPNGMHTYSQIKSKENAWNNKNCKRMIAEGNSTPVANKRMKILETPQENSKDLSGFLSKSPSQNSSFSTSPSKNTPKSGSYSISALCSLEQQNQHNLQQQHEQQNGQAQENLEQQKHQQQNQQHHHHHHQIQQNDQQQPQQPQIQQQQQQNQHIHQQQHNQHIQHQLQENKRQQKKQQQQHLHQVNQQLEIGTHQQQEPCLESSVTLQSAAKPSFVVSRMREVYVPSNEQYLEWVEKSGSKSRFDTRTCHFSSQVVHNSRNTFMPITETEVFDGTENAFGLSLNAPDISGDLFTSLQVPNGGHHSESISPTAAFLLTFPLVSTSKASELLPDENVCDNADSQSGMKTILQIGNIEKCSNTLFSVTEEGLNNFGLTSQFGQNTNSQKDAHVMRNVEDKVASSQADKLCNTDGLVFKETAMIVHKGVSNNSLDQSGLYLSKNQQGQHSSQVSKPDLQVSSIVSAAELPAVSHSSVTTVVGAKARAPNKCSSDSESQKSSAKERKDDRNSSWSTTGSHQATIPLNPFADLVGTKDTSLNFPALPSLPSIIPLSSSSSTSQPYLSSDLNYKAPYSQPNVTSSFSIAQTSSNMGILSWSTLPSADSHNPSRNNPKLARFHDIFSYRSSGSTDATSSGSTSYVSNVVAPLDPKSQTNLIPSSEHNLLQVPLTSTDNRSKSTVVNYSSSNTQTRSRSNVPHFEGSGKKQFPSNSESTSKQIYDQGTPLYTHAPMIDAKQLCSQESYDKNNSSLGQYPAMNVQSKQTMSGDFNKVKQIPTCDAFSSGKLANYNHCSEPKEPSQRREVETCSLNVSSDPKHHENINFNHVSDGKKSSLNSSKERSSLGAYITSNGNVSQCNQTNNTNNAPVQQKEAFKHPEQLHPQIHKQSHPMNEKGAQKQYQQPELHLDTNQVNHHHQQSQNQPSSSEETLPCARSSKTTMSIHRPPVNWMTAPDIRSSLQNSPAFGNNQTAYYIPDYQKDADGTSMFDPTNSFHCLELPHSSAQIIYKNSDLQLLGNDQLESIHEPTAWSPSKSGSNSVLGSMLIPSTLPTLVGDLALGDSNATISRPFLPTFSAESSPCSKKNPKRSHSMKNSDKAMDDVQQVVQGAEFSTNFLSVSQLVDSGANRNKGRQTSLPTNRIILQPNVNDGPCYPVSFPEQDISQCSQSIQPPKQSSSKCPSSSYSAEALISNPVINSHQVNKKKRPSNSFSSNYVAPDVLLGTFTATSQSQCNFLPDLSISRPNDFQGGLSHSETMPPPFMLSSTNCNTSGSNRNGIPEDESQIRRVVPQGPTDNLHLTGSMTGNKQVTANGSNALDVSMSYESNFPAFLPPVSVAMTHHPYSQDTLYSTSRFQVHPNANNNNSNVQSPSANTLTNFHLSTIFPEINGKVLC